MEVVERGRSLTGYEAGAGGNQIIVISKEGIV